MSGRTTDTLTAVAGIAGIVIIITVCTCLGYDHTIIKLGIAAIAGLAGFSIRGLIRWQ
jgi:hypothetical protein